MKLIAMRYTLVRVVAFVKYLRRNMLKQITGKITFQKNSFWVPDAERLLLSTDMALCKILLLRTIFFNTKLDDNSL